MQRFLASPDHPVETVAHGVEVAPGELQHVRLAGQRADALTHRIEVRDQRIERGLLRDEPQWRGAGRHEPRRIGIVSGGRRESVAHYGGGTLAPIATRDEYNLQMLPISFSYARGRTEVTPALLSDQRMVRRHF